MLVLVAAGLVIVASLVLWFGRNWRVPFLIYFDRTKLEEDPRYQLAKEKLQLSSNRRSSPSTTASILILIFLIILTVLFLAFHSSK
jgi:hypothetical protein